MAASDYLSKLPSLDELLENPRVSAAVERLNQSAAATQVRGAISRVGAELSRRAEDLTSLGASELLDRLVSQIDRPRSPRAASVVNATGRMDGACGLTPPLPSAAWDAAYVAGAGFRRPGASVAAGVAQRVLGAEHACVFGSPTMALLATLETLAAGSVCLVARGEMGEAAPGVRIDDLCRRAGVTLVEVGATDAATGDDFANELRRADPPGGSQAVVLSRRSSGYEVVGGAAPLTTAELAGVARQYNSLLIEEVAVARPRRDTPSYGDEAPSAEEALAEGADLVLLDGAGSVGGPAAGIVAGKKGPVGKVASSLLAKADCLDPLVDAALAATLALFDRPDQLRFTHPLYELLDAPRENLRVRAERLAPQIAESSLVAGATVAESEATCQIRVAPTDGDIVGLSDRLAGRDPSILSAADEDALVLDLRSVFPRQDRELVEAFIGAD